MAEGTRIDKYLWAIRVFKTRTDATDACKGGKVRLNGNDVKPSRTVACGDVINVRKGAVLYSYKVVATIEKRVGAKLIPEILENVTPPEQYELLEMNRISGFVNRARGTGRPTKKDRRSLDEFTTQEYLDDLLFDFDMDDGGDDAGDD